MFTVAIIGESGTGKDTLANELAPLLPNTSIVNADEILQCALKDCNIELSKKSPFNVIRILKNLKRIISSFETKLSNSCSAEIAIIPFAYLDNVGLINQCDVVINPRTSSVTRKSRVNERNKTDSKDFFEGFSVSQRDFLNKVIPKKSKVIDIAFSNDGDISSLKALAPVIAAKIMKQYKSKTPKHSQVSYLSWKSPNL